ncbi:MAG: TrmJ/YjtD family RNA methyltransferase [Cyclobacteriaceae bacterium]|nr:TrmJ/YjtD family RNA methyltransferase [Cyclobacteriaceae bacterium]
MPSIHFILLEPSVPENVGFSVRALKTMGFNSIRLINPCNHLGKMARKTAYGSHDLLESAVLYDTLEDCLQDIDFCVGTTAHKRAGRHDSLDPKEVKETLRNKGETINSIGILFGREDRGLEKHEINACDVVSTIPLATAYPSLNLAQSILIYAYELKELLVPIEKTSPTKPSGNDYSLVKSELIEILNKKGFDKKPALFQRIMDRIALLREDDLTLLSSLIKKIERN